MRTFAFLFDFGSCINKDIMFSIIPENNSVKYPFLN